MLPILTIAFSFFISDVSQDLKELTDTRISRLSRKLTTQSDVRKLGIEGLRLESEDVDRHISDHKNDIATAAYHIIYDWRKSKDNLTIAYGEICMH